MISDDNELDPALRRAMLTLSRNASPSADFADRVVLDLGRRGLVGHVPTYGANESLEAPTK